MKTIVAAAFAAVLMSSAAGAQGLDPRYPYCVRGKLGLGDSFDCSYTTIQQCRATASPDGYCQRNPAYRGGTARPDRGYR
jgi:hypothetical protein